MSQCLPAADLKCIEQSSSWFHRSWYCCDFPFVEWNVASLNSHLAAVNCESMMMQARFFFHDWFFMLFLLLWRLIRKTSIKTKCEFALMTVVVCILSFVVWIPCEKYFLPNNQKKLASFFFVVAKNDAFCCFHSICYYSDRIDALDSIDYTIEIK